MEFLNALQSKSSSCADVSMEEEATNSTEYHTVSDDEETITGANYDTVSEDLSVDLNSEDQPASVSEYQTLSPDNDDNLLAGEQSHGGPDYECKICVKRFRTLQECLRHELLEHNNGQKSPKKSVRTSLSHLLPAFQHTDQQADRKRIHELFQKCRPGQELQELFNIYCIGHEKVKQIINAVNECLLKDLWSLQNIRVYTFGSCENGLMMWDSDIDVYVSTRSPFEGYRNRQNFNMERQIYNRINGNLRRGHYFDEVIAIRRARVPIIKCRHLATGMRIDLNCSCPNSVVNTSFLRDLMLFDVRIHSFMRFMKVWAKHMWIVGRNRMTSYCFCILVLFYLQQSLDHNSPLVPAIKKMQYNVPPKFVQGVNYAVELFRNMKPVPVTVTTSNLIRGFFRFYRNFDFSKNIIAPYLGVTIPIDDFLSAKYKYTAYQHQLRSMEAVANQRYKVEELNVERVMVVQDPFQLNQNVSRGVLSSQLEYLRKCIEYGYHICMDADIRADGQFYEMLLFDIIGNIKKEAQQLSTCTTGGNTALMQPHEMLYTFTPCRAEIRALTAQQLNATLANGSIVKNVDSTYRIWARHYIEAIYVILTRVYGFSVRLLNETDDPFDKRLLQHPANDLIEHTFDRSHIVDSLEQFDKENQVVWVISGTVDTWSERIFQRESTQTFISFQYAQTQKFLDERRGKAAYAVNLLGRFSLKPLENYKMLEILIKQHQQTRQWFCKKDPLRRFFTNFKCSLQNFNLKEKLQAESGRSGYSPPNKSVETAFWEAVASEIGFKEQMELKTDAAINDETIKGEQRVCTAEKENPVKTQ